MRDTDATLQEFATFLLQRRLVKENAAPYCVRWVRRFLARPASTDPLVDQVRSFCEDLERDGTQDWQVRQAEHALRIYWLKLLSVRRLGRPACRCWRRRPGRATTRARGASPPDPHAPLLLSDRGRVRRLEPPLPDIPGRNTGHRATARRCGWRTRLPHAPGRTTARVSSHPEPGAGRNPPAVP